MGVPLRCWSDTQCCRARPGAAPTRHVWGTRQAAGRETPRRLCCESANENSPRGHETNYLSQKNKISSDARVKGLQKLRTDYAPHRRQRWIY